MDKFLLLLSQYCDNDLSPKDEAEFVAWLASDPANVDRFVRASHLHSLTFDVIQEYRLQSDAWSRTLKDNDPYNRISEITPQPTPRLIGRNAWMLAAAALLVGVLATVAFWPPLRSPALVAQVTSLTGAASTTSGQAVLVGALLPEGESLRVTDGDLLVTFECGAKVLVEAPSTFVVTGAATGSLLEGKASARVPTQAIGFAIYTPLLDVVDLGTEFQLAILNDKQLDLHVFDGLVEVRLTKEFQHAEDGPLQISQGRSVRFDLQANEIITLNYDESLKRVF